MQCVCPSGLRGHVKAVICSHAWVQIPQRTLQLLFLEIVVMYSNTNIMNNIIQLILAICTVLTITKSLDLAIFISILMPIIVCYTFLTTKIPSMTLFAWVKGLSVFIPLILYTCFTKINKVVHVPVIVFSIILAVNILEPPLLVQFLNDEPLSIINGILTVILALYTPLLSVDKNTELIGFDNHWLWVIANVTILGSFYLFHDFYKSAPTLQKWLLFAIIFPAMHSFITGTTREWLATRIYSLAMLLFVYSIPSLRNKVNSNVDNHFTDYTKDKSDWLRLISVIINIGIAAMMIKEGNKNTVIGYLLNKV